MTGIAAVGVPAAADEAARQATVATHLEAGTLAAGETELAAILAKDPMNDDARLGLGTIRFVAPSSICRRGSTATA